MIGRRRGFRRSRGALLAELDGLGAAPWEARVQDFRAGGFLPAGVIVVSPEAVRTRRPAGRARAYSPFLVFILDHRATTVTPAVSRLFDHAANPQSGSGRRLYGRGRWSVLDGPQPYVKLAVEGSDPVRVKAAIVLPATPLAGVLAVASSGAPIGLVPASRARRVTEELELEDALRELVLVRVDPSPDLLALVRDRGWPVAAEDLL